MKIPSRPSLLRAPFKARIPTATALGLLALASLVHAADDSWTGATNGNWNVDSNWVTAAPGATTGVNNADTATFDTAPANTNITIDAGRNIRNITFDGDAGSYTFGGGTLQLASDGTLLMTANVADGVTQTFNNALSLNGNYDIRNLDDGTARFVFAGGITAATKSTLYFYTYDTTATTTLNTISGVMADGAGALSVSFGNYSSGNGRGRYEITGNNTYSGTTTINFRGGAAGVNGELITSGTHDSDGEVNLSRGTLTLNNTSNGGISRGLLTMGAGSYLRANRAGAGTLSNNVRTTNSVNMAGDHDITINGTFTNGAADNRSLSNTIVSGQKLTLNGNVYLSNDSATGRNWAITGSGETLINGDVSDFSGGKGSAASGINFSSSGTGPRKLTLAGTNTYSGDTILGGGASTLFVLAESGSMTFYIADNGVNNRVTGNGTAEFNGSFNFDLSGADLTEGNSWNIVDIATVIESFTSSFSVTGFTQSGAIWSDGNGFSFDTSTGVLSYSAVPEPSTYALFAALAGLLVAVKRRARRSA